MSKEQSALTIENSDNCIPASWVFDVDGCLIDSLTGSSLRPGAAELLSELHRAGVRIFVWSAGGEAHARARLKEQAISHLVYEFLSKSQRGPDGRYRWRGPPSPSRRCSSTTISKTYQLASMPSASRPTSPQPHSTVI
jgi:hypothetical protein